MYLNSLYTPASTSTTTDFLCSAICFCCSASCLYHSPKMTTSLTVHYNLNLSKSEQTDNPALKMQDERHFPLQRPDLASLSQAITAARAGMNETLTAWKEAVDERAKEKAAEEAWERQRLQAEKEKFDKGEPDESDEEDLEGEDA